MPSALTFIVVSSDGPSLKHHRRLTSPAFSEKNNRLVWEVALDRTPIMIQSFRGPDGKLQTSQKIASNITRLSLEVLWRASLGQKLEWAPETASGNLENDPHGVNRPKDDFVQNLQFFMVNIISIMMVKSGPWWVQPFGKFIYGDLPVK